MMEITLETDNGSVTIEATCVRRDIDRRRVDKGIETTVTEIWQERNGQKWEYTQVSIQGPMPRLDGSIPTR